MKHLIFLLLACQCGELQVKVPTRHACVVSQNSEAAQVCIVKANQQCSNGFETMTARTEKDGAYHLYYECVIP